MIDYRDVEERCLSEDLMELMRLTPQDQRFHGEGSVLVHTLMVHDLLDTNGLTERQTSELRVAALLHDIGKVRTTIVNGSDITSPNHSVIGSRMAREILWKSFGLAGTKEAICFRETVAALVRYHSLPPHVLDDEYALSKTYRAACSSLLGATDFTLDLLYRLSKADMAGRVCQGKQDSMAAIECFRDLAEEEGILWVAPGFTDYDYNQKYNLHKFLGFKSGNCKNPALYNDTWGTVFLLVGLPGTGKDTYIQRNHHDIPTISLDGIRRELKLQPGSTDGRVIQIAKGRAKEYLREERPFVWNATNLTQQRRSLIELFESYRASVSIEYLETTPSEQSRRNHSRPEVVPTEVIDEMIGKLVLPEYHEAHTVTWEIV